jgi:Tfp pilus assembly protein PilX
MNRTLHPLQSQRGVGLVNAMLALSLLAVFALVAASLAINEKRTSFNDIVHTGAFLSADSGGEEAIAWLRQQTRPPAILDLDVSTSVQNTTNRYMELAGAQQEFDYSIRLRTEAVDGPNAVPIRGRVGYDASDYADYFYVIDSLGESGDLGESRVSLLVSKLSSMNYQ